MAMLSQDGTLTTYDHENSALRAAAGTEDYVRVRGIATEPDGTLWAINQFSPFPLVIRTSDGSWSSIPPVRAQGAPPSLTYLRIFVDSYGQKWILADQNQGLIVMQSGTEPGDTGDDSARYIRGLGSGGVGLPNETVTAWAEDGFGHVWIGTERGIAVYLAPNLMLSDQIAASQAQWPITDLESGERAFLLRDLFVNGFAVDPANQLWIASRTGVWLLKLFQTGGAEIVAHFTKDNSPLFSDEVIAVGVDARSGRAYFATNKGLVSWQGSAVNPSSEAEELFIFPNPAGPGVAQTADVTIDGLVSETDVRILTVSGVLVRQIDGRGGRVVWDGLTDQGEPAPSGVYLVAAVGKNGEGTAYGKIAFVR
jgi:hypothetical protein